MKNNTSGSSSQWVFLLFLLILVSTIVTSQAQVLLGKTRGAGSTATPLSIAAQKLKDVAIKALNERGYSDLAEVTVAGNQPLGRWGKLASSMASPDSAAGGGSILTMDLPPAPLAELVNVMDLYQSLFGITPDFSNVNDTSSFYQKVQDILLSSAPAIALDCLPSFRIWPQEINAGFPDQHSVAHFIVLPSFGPNDLVMIEGTFPAARYFSYQTYNANSVPVASLRDAQIVPLANKRNPFATPPTEDSKANATLEKVNYRIYLTKDGKRGFPNELAVAKSNFALGALTIVVLRLVGIDPRADLSNPELAPWGFVPPVRVSAKIMGTFAPTSTDIVWETYPQCPLNNTLAVRDALTALTNLVSMFGMVGKQTCLSENVRDNFMLYQPEEPEHPPGLGLGVIPPGIIPPPPSRTFFTNRDAAFLVACAHNRPKYLKSSDLVAVVRGHLPRTPGGLLDIPVVGDARNYQVRYASMSVVDLNLPGPTVRTVSDDEFRSFYRKRYGNVTWELTYGRNVSVMVAKNRAVLQRCGLDTSDSFVVALAAHEPVSDWFGVVYRELLPQGMAMNSTPNNKGLASTMGKVGLRPYAESIDDAKQSVCGPDGTCDPNPYRVAQEMRMHMPRIDYYLCSASGVLHVAPPATPDPFVGKGYPLLTDKLLGAGEDQTLPEDAVACAYQMATGDSVEGLVRVYAPAAWAHLHIDGHPVKVFPPGQVGPWNLSVPVVKDGLGAVVLGLSLKAKTANEAAFLAEVEVCGDTYVADSRWHCSEDPPLDDSWLYPTFVEGPGWKPATWARAADGVSPRSLAVVSTPGGHGRRGKGQPAQQQPTPKLHVPPPTSPTHFFAKDNRRFIQPSPQLELEAEKAWGEWKQAKEDANNAWRSWRRAKEHPQQQHQLTTANATTNNTTNITTTEEVNDKLGNNKDGVTSTMRSVTTNGSLSTDWKDHMNASADGVTLQWAKPRHTNVHGFYCRFVVLNGGGGGGGGGGSSKKAGRSVLG